MALITSPTEMIPDLNYEYHTITIDSVGQTNANTFTCHLQQPLKNVVQARLVAARINTTTSDRTLLHIYKRNLTLFSLTGPPMFSQVNHL